MESELGDKPGWLLEVKLMIEAATKDLAHRLKPPPIIQPIYFTHTKAASANAAGIAVVKFGPPEPGHTRFIRSIRVSGQTPTTVASGRADVYVSSSDALNPLASLAEMPQADWRDQATTLPLVAPYGGEELAQPPNHTLYIVFSSATAGQQYYASISATEVSRISQKQVEAM